MSGKLFAFQLARPAESTEPMSCEYDPQTQTMVWQGGTAAQALGKSYCTDYIGGATWCKIIGGVACFTADNCAKGWGFICDAQD